MATTPEPVRPRFGRLTHADGSYEPLVFLPTDDPAVFEAVLAGPETPVSFTTGDRLTVDVLGAGQSVTFRCGI